MFLGKFGYGCIEKLKFENIDEPYMELINRYFTSFQINEMKRTGWIPVRGSNNTMYYVASGVSDVFMIEKNEKFKHRCLVVDNVDYLDAAIAKVLLIQADQNLFESTAL